MNEKERDLLCRAAAFLRFSTCPCVECVAIRRGCSEKIEQYLIENPVVPA